MNDYYFVKTLQPLTSWIQSKHSNGLVCWYMVLYATFNNISVILWRSVLLVWETEVSAAFYEYLMHIHTI